MDGTTAQRPHPVESFDFKEASGADVHNPALDRWQTGIGQHAAGKIFGQQQIAPASSHRVVTPGGELHQDVSAVVGHELRLFAAGR